MKRIQIYTDGGCRGNPGIGGWAAVLVCGEHRKEISGSAQETTNNRMELIAAFAAFFALKKPCSVELFSDSEYVIKGITEWAPKWARNGWRTSDKKPVKNEDLWRMLLDEIAAHDLTCTWVRGHAGHPENERCDKLANDEMDKLEQNRA